MSKSIILYSLLFSFLVLVNGNTEAQSVGINFNAAAPNSAAALDIDVSALGTKKGLLIPRVTLNDRTVGMATLVTPAQGLIVYQTDGVQGFYYNTSLTTTPNWIFVANAANGGVRWDQLQNSAGDLTLLHGAHSTLFNFDGATNTPFTLTSNTISAGSIMSLILTSAAGAASGSSSILSASRGGVNANANHSAKGLSASVTNSGTGSTNYAGYFFANGAVSNYGVYSYTDADNGVGVFGLNNSTGTGLQVGISGNKSGSNGSGSGGTGVSGTATGAGVVNTGGDFYASGGSVNYGVRGSSDANDGVGLYGVNNSTVNGFAYGILGNKSGSTASGTGYAVYGTATGTGNINYGGDFNASGATNNYGSFSVASGAAVNNYGGWFTASGATNNYAAIFNQGNVGIGTATPLTKLHVKGTVNVFDGGTSAHTGSFWAGTSNVDGVEIVTSAGGDTYIGVQREAGAGVNLSRTSGAGTLVSFNVGGTTVGTISTSGTTTSYNTTSDIRLKENIVPSGTGLNTILKIKVKDYNYRSDAKKEMHTGFIAQELYNYYPQAVHAGGADAKTDPWTIDYSKLTPLLVKAVQDQQKEIEDYKVKINDLTERMNKLEKLLTAKPAANASQTRQ